jgi:hypothetical protein
MRRKDADLLRLSDSAWAEWLLWDLWPLTVGLSLVVEDLSGAAEGRRRRKHLEHLAMLSIAAGMLESFPREGDMACLFDLDAETSLDAAATDADSDLWLQIKRRVGDTAADAVWEFREYADENGESTFIDRQGRLRRAYRGTRHGGDIAHYVRPRDLVAWCESKGVPLPETPRKWLRGQEVASRPTGDFDAKPGAPQALNVRPLSSLTVSDMPKGGYRLEAPDGRGAEFSPHHNRQTNEQVIVFLLAQAWPGGVEVSTLLESIYPQYCRENVESALKCLCSTIDSRRKKLHRAGLPEDIVPALTRRKAMKKELVRLDIARLTRRGVFKFTDSRCGNVAFDESRDSGARFSAADE